MILERETLTVGQRAVLEIQEMSRVEELTIQQECDNLSVSMTAYCTWKSGKKNPTSKALRELALMGYDVFYILTGERK